MSVRESRTMSGSAMTATTTVEIVMGLGVMRVIFFSEVITVTVLVSVTIALLLDSRTGQLAMTWKG